MGLLRNVTKAGLLGAVLLSLALAGCGLGRKPDSDGGTISDPVVAARVNGRPIYIEDVRAYAVQRRFLEEGEDLDANSDAFYFALEELIEVRLFAAEGEARGLDRDPDVRRRLEAARERVLANAIYEELQTSATDPDAVERLYQENTRELGQGQEIHLRHIQFQTREAAEAAKRRLDRGEPFEALAFELSTDRATAADGGDLRFGAVDDLQAPVREAIQDLNVGQVSEPIQIADAWHVFKIVDRRERGVPSLETMRPQIVNWLLFEETQRLRDRLERDARIERLREQDVVAEPGEDVEAPADAEEPQRPTTAPAIPGQRQPPPFPFPMGPGGVYGGEERPQTESAPAGPPPSVAPAAPPAAVQPPAEPPAQQPAPAQ